MGKGNPCRKFTLVWWDGLFIRHTEHFTSLGKGTKRIVNLSKNGNFGVLVPFNSVLATT